MLQRLISMKQWISVLRRHCQLLLVLSLQLQTTENIPVLLILVYNRTSAYQLEINYKVRRLYSGLYFFIWYRDGTVRRRCDMETVLLA